MTRGLFWTMFGAAVGAGVALLYAPCAGSETRDMLARNARRMKNKTQDAIEQGKKAMTRAQDKITRSSPSY